MTLLHGRLTLHGVDSEKLARRALDDSLHSRQLEWHRHDDAIAFLVALCWQLSLQFDSSRGQAFSTFAYRILRLRVVDWFRQTDGRTRWQSGEHVYERERPELVSFERDPGDGGLAATLAARSGDPTADWSPDLAGILEEGNRDRARDFATLGLEPPRRAA